MLIYVKPEESEPPLPQFFLKMNEKYINKKPTCYKSLNDPSCIGLIITSSSNFKNMKTIS